ncbi:MAG: FHA domain-containing protein [Armatimonadetes bacterium]|nr:FHA domain-containing protein [Armatimonadota bacterium]MBS1712001.1 FHA domain-containing protein [Armatimonadota bacterium]MBX3109445.1 FHA domain-containing protein [Fimbriimonadaceae bacterium]
MNKLATYISVLSLLALTACSENSSRIEFVSQPAVIKEGGQGSVRQYVRVFKDDAHTQPVKGLKADAFSVEVLGKKVKPSVYPSREEGAKVGVSVLLDLSGKEDQQGKSMIETVRQLKRSESIHFIALTAANGKSVDPVKLNAFVPAAEFQFKDPAFGVTQATRTLAGILIANNVSKESPANGKAVYATVAVVRTGGKDTGEKIINEKTGEPIKWPSTQPVIVLNYGTEDPALKQIASDSGGEYIQASGSVSADFDKVNEAVRRSVGDRYAVRFPISGADVVPPFKLSVTHDGGTDVAEIAPEKFTYQLATILAVALVALAISVLVIRRRGVGSRAPAPAVPMASPALNSMQFNDATVGDTTVGGMQRGSGPITAPPIHPGAVAARAGDATMGETGFQMGGGHSGYVAGSFRDNDSTIGGPTMGVNNLYGGSNAGDVTTGEDTMGNLFVPTHRSAVLRVVSGGAAGREVALRNDTEIGRSDGFLFQDGFLGLPGDGKISRLHARIRLINGGRVEIEHRSNTNRTYVNGQTIDDREVLQVGDKIRMGDTVLEVIGIDHGDATF